MKRIENENYKVEFCEAGGEIYSFYDKKNDVEYMYQGKSGSWSGKNPTLFPIVGNTYDGTYVTKGETYSFKNHGLIRYATLNVFEEKENAITFELKANDETLKAYPYDFTYHITYTLDNNKLTVVYNITNNDKDVMPFTFGLHPGFNTNLSNDSYNDYSIEFENEEELQQLIFDGNKVNKHYYEDIKMKSFNLDHKIMEKYLTLIYKGMSSSYVTLKGKDKGVKVSIAGYPLLAFWTPKENDQFICIEPWYSHADFEKNDCKFEDREGMMKLEPKKTWTTSYSIEVF